MKKFLLSIALFVFVCGSVLAQIQTDDLTRDPVGRVVYLIGLSVNCDASRQGQTVYVKTTNTAGSMYFCNNNHGYYEWVPMNPGTSADMWFALDMTQIDAFGGSLVRGGTLTGRDGEPNHPGILEIATGTTVNTNAFGSMHAGSSSRGTFAVTATNWTCEVIFQLAQTTDTLINIGMTSEADAPDASNVAFFEYDSATDTNWQAITRDGTGEAGQTETDSGVAVTTGWTRALVVWNGTDIKFYLKVGDGDYVLEATHTADLPADYLACHAQIQNLEASNKIIRVDYMRNSQIQIER